MRLLLYTCRMKSVFLFSTILACIFTMIAFHACTKDQGVPASFNVNPCTTTAVSYSATIDPIIQSNCATSKACHKAGTTNADYSTYAGFAAKADPPLGNGALRERVIAGPNWMPDGNPLPDSLKNKIDCWLRNGAPNN